jgi:hypothetical protein
MVPPRELPGVTRDLFPNFIVSFLLVPSEVDAVEVTLELLFP